MRMTTRHPLTPEEKAERQQQVDLLQSLVSKHEREPFETIANRLLTSKLLAAAHFEVLPVIFKTPALRNYQNMMPATRMRLAQPWCNVAIFSERGVGGLMFIDIDNPKTVQDIEKSKGKLFPDTYSVVTRPFSTHEHYYFRQTDYSVKQFRKNINIRDLDNLKTTLYDVKGIGGTSYVVAAGSIRENGDLYAIGNSSPVQDITPWLVDWIVADFKKFKAGKATLRRQHLAKQKALAMEFTPEQRAEMRSQNNPDGFPIAESDTREFLSWRAAHLASFGFSRDVIRRGLKHLLIENCVNGKDYLEKHGDTIIRIAESPSLHIGDSTWFYERAEKTMSGLTGQVPPQSRHGAMVEIIEAFPNEIDSDAAWKFLREGIVDFDKRSGMKQAVANARAEAGFKVKTLGNHRWLWVRKESR
jgi:hypothetical protein